MVDALQRLALLQTNPERYATTGLDWGNPNHHEAIAQGLFQNLMGHIARQQEYFGRPEGKALRHQQTRIEHRLSVAERALYRSGRQSPRQLEDAVVIYGLEKMADNLEDGADAWRRAKDNQLSNVVPGAFLSGAVSMAGTVRGYGALSRFSIGPFGALSKIGAFITRLDISLEMDDLPALAELVTKARGIPAGYVVHHANEACKPFYDGFYALLEKLQTRDRDVDWTA